MPVSVIPMGAVAPSSPLLLPRPNPFSTEALSMGPIADLTPAFLRSHKAAFPDCSILRGKDYTLSLFRMLLRLSECALDFARVE